MNDVMTSTYINGDEIQNFEFYTNLSAADKLKFVNSVSSLLADGENYNFIIRDLIFDFYIVNVFTTDNNTRELIRELEESSTFIKDVEEFLERTNIAEIIKINADYGLIDELNHAVDLNIQYRTGIHPNRLNEALTSLVNTIERKISEVDLSSMMEMAQLLTGMTEELTPESIVNAYMESDIHKNNLVEIEEAKKRRAEFAEDMDKAIKIVGNKTKK